MGALKMYEPTGHECLWALPSEMKDMVFKTVIWLYHVPTFGYRPFGRAKLMHGADSRDIAVRRALQ